MAEGGDFEWFKNDDYGDYPDDDDDNADVTTPFFPNGSSTPYQAHVQEEIGMKSFQEKSGRPGPSYAETSFGGTEDLERRLANLRRDHITQMLDTTKIPNVENPLSLEEKQIEIQKVRAFIKKKVSKRRYRKTSYKFFFFLKKTNGYCC